MIHWSNGSSLKVLVLLLIILQSNTSCIPLAELSAELRGRIPGDTSSEKKKKKVSKSGLGWIWHIILQHFLQLCAALLYWFQPNYSEQGKNTQVFLVVLWCPPLLTALSGLHQKTQERRALWEHQSFMTGVHLVVLPIWIRFEGDPERSERFCLNPLRLCTYRRSPSWRSCPWCCSVLRLNLSEPFDWVTCRTGVRFNKATTQFNDWMVKLQLMNIYF